VEDDDPPLGAAAAWQLAAVKVIGVATKLHLFLFESPDSASD
jgi:hypothetical protein